MANKKKPEITAEPAQSDVESASKHTWPEILRRAGKPTPEDAALYRVTVEPSVLTEMGTHIRSQRILTDLLRWSGQILDFWTNGSDEERACAVGFSFGLLQVVIQEGDTLRGLVAKKTGVVAGQDAVLEADATTAAETFDAGSKQRDLARATLRAAAIGDRALLARIDVAFGTGADSQALATSMKALAKVGASLLKANGLPSERLLKSNANAAHWTALEALAAKVQSTGERATGARTGSGVSQAALDLQDGVCLTLMGILLDLFGAAHGIHPIVPNLTPISTRRFFSTHRKTAPAETPVAPANPPVGAQASAALPKT